MAIAIGSILSGNNTAATVGTTGTISPVANRLYLMSIATRTGISAEPNLPTITGGGLTWVNVNSCYFDNTSASRKKVSLFRGLSSSPSSAPGTIDFGGQTQTNIVWGLDELTGIDTSGTNGSGAIVQSVVGSNPSVGTYIAGTLAAFGDTGNATFGLLGGEGANGTAGAGFTLSVSNATDVNISINSEFKAANDTVVDFSSVSMLSGIIGVEIKAAAAGATIFPNWKSLLGVGY